MMTIQAEPNFANTADRPTALITGGSNGIGRATAELFARNGYDVIVWGQNEARLAEVGQIEGIITADRVDVRNTDEVTDALSRTFGDGRRLDVLVQSAGAVGLHSFTEATVDQAMSDLEQMVEANLTSVARVGKAALEYFRESGGSIVNISSEAASTGVGLSWAYTATKGAVDAMTRAWANELGPRRHISVNAIAPGFVANTGMTGGLEPKDQEKIANEVPIRRNSTPENIAGAAFFLANAESMTGQILHMNGGRYFGK